MKGRQKMDGRWAEGSAGHRAAADVASNLLAGAAASGAWSNISEGTLRTLEGPKDASLGVLPGAKGDTLKDVCQESPRIEYSRTSP